MSKLNFSEMKLTEIDGTPIEAFEGHKLVANLLWKHAKNLDLVETAMKINRGEEVEMSESDIKELEALIKDPQNQLFAFARKTVLDFIGTS